MNRAISYRRCPRCGGYGYETLKTYSHCVNCNFINDREIFDFDTSLLKVKKQIRRAQYFTGAEHNRKFSHA